MGLQERHDSADGMSFKILTLYLISITCIQAANLDIPVAQSTGPNNCSGSAEGQIFRNGCFVDQNEGYRVVQYRPGDFCSPYRLTCNAATGTVFCSLFNSGFNVAPFEIAPAQVPAGSIGNCTGQNTCSFSGVYPNPAGTSVPYVGLYKTQFTTDRRLNFTIDCTTGGPASSTSPAVPPAVVNPSSTIPASTPQVTSPIPTASSTTAPVPPPGSSTSTPPTAVPTTAAESVCYDESIRSKLVRVVSAGCAYNNVIVSCAL